MRPPKELEKIGKKDCCNCGQERQAQSGFILDIRVNAVELKKQAKIKKKEKRLEQDINNFICYNCD